MFGLGKQQKNYEDISVQKFEELMKEDDTVIIDVRTPAEQSDGVVPGHQMINIMSGDFDNKIAALDKSKTYLVYCRSGNRSGQACQRMSQMGFEHLYNLKGGIGAWNASHA